MSKNHKAFVGIEFAKSIVDNCIQISTYNYCVFCQSGDHDAQNKIVHEDDCIVLKAKGVLFEQEYHTIFDPSIDKYIDDASVEIIEKAKKWDALVNSSRIRILGSAKLGETKYQHFGVELFHFADIDTNPLIKDKFDPKETEYGKEVFEKYVDGIIKSDRQELLKKNKTKIDKGEFDTHAFAKIDIEQLGTNIKNNHQQDDNSNTKPFANIHNKNIDDIMR